MIVIDTYILSVLCSPATRIVSASIKYTLMVDGKK